MNTYVLAVDPGGTTGFAWWRDGRNPHVSEAKPMKFLDIADDLIARAHGDVLIACERYVLAPGARSAQYDALEQIGALKWIAHRRGATLVLQSPADAKRFVSNDVLRKLGWYTVGMDHGRDATRHLVLRLVRDGRLSLL